jgi:hypothetical protein
MFTPNAGTKVKNFVLTTRHVVVVLVYIYVRANECVSGNGVCVRALMWCSISQPGNEFHQCWIIQYRSDFFDKSNRILLWVVTAV